MIFASIVVASFLIQVYFIVWALRGLKKLTEQPAANGKIQRQFSIIIAAHNEEKNIGKCLRLLSEQFYPDDYYEVIVAVDRCSDNTVGIVRGFQRSFPNLRIIEIQQVPVSISPKKFAIDAAIKKARFEHLLFLDADVAPSPNHLQTMNRYFTGDTSAVVSLMKFTEPNSFWQRFLVFEKLISWCIAGAGIGRQKPVISYGGNWGYTKTAFQIAGGFQTIDHSLSGDDDLLLQKMGEAQLPVVFCLEPDGWVRTAPPKTLSHFLRQRRRHFSAGKNYRSALQMGYFLYHVSNLILWIGWLFWKPAIILLIVKLMGDVLVVRKGNRMFREHFRSFSIILFDFLYLLYNVLIGPMGHFGRIKW